MNKRQLLTLLILANFGGAFAERSRRSACDCEPVKVPCCEKQRDKKSCVPEPATLSFECCMSFEQVIDEEGDSRDPQEKPEGVCGRFRISFKPDLSEAYYQLKVTGIETTRNPNEELVGAFLHCGTPSTPPGGGKATPIIALAGLTNDGSTCDTPANAQCDVDNGEFCCSGTIRNSDLNFEDDIEIKTVAALLQTIRAGLVFVSVNGCGENETNPSYKWRLDGGMLRCQLLGTEVEGRIKE